MTAYSGGRLLRLLACSALVAACAGSDGGAATTDATMASTTSNSAAISTSPETTLPLDRQHLLDDLRTSYGAPGALAELRDGTTVWRGASGTADVANTPITDSTRFRIASITKPIVAALVLAAVADGKLRLDDVVGDLLPGVLRPDQPVTVRMILDHTSGVFDESNDGDPIADSASLSDPVLVAEAADLKARYEAGEHIIVPGPMLVALSETHDRYFAPGQGFHYSNTNYQLAAMVLERVTGRTLSELLQTEIVEPLGLVHTTLTPPDTSSPEMRGYGTSSTDGALVDMSDDLTLMGNGGSGGIISNADELLRVFMALLSGRLVPADLVDDMMAPSAASYDSYGLGLATYYSPCGKLYGHEGGVNGTGSIVMVTADGARGVVVAINLRSGDDPHLPQIAERYVCSQSE